MTNKHEHINAAIRAAEVAVWGKSPEVLHPWKREMARALVAELLRRMKPIAVPDQTGLNAAWDAGYNAALFDLKSIAGLEFPR